MKRIKITSRQAKTRVYFKLPQADPNKKYKLWVEKLTVPTLSSESINGELFEVQRRLRPGQHQFPTDNLGQTLKLFEQYKPKFVATNVKTPLDLVTQINTFLSELLRRAATFYTSNVSPQGLTYSALVNYPVTDFQVPAHSTWNNITEIGGVRDKIGLAITAVIDARGNFGFRFSPEAIPLFAISLTPQGRLTWF